MIKIVKTWDEIPPVVYDGEDAFSIRYLERNYRKMKEALLKIRDMDCSRAMVNISAVDAVGIASEALDETKAISIPKEKK